MKNWRLLVGLLAAFALAFALVGCGDKKAEDKKAEPKKEAPKEVKKADEAPAEKKAEAAEEKPAEEKPAEEKPAEEKPAEEKPAEEKPAEEAPPEAKPEEVKIDEGVMADIKKVSECTAEDYSNYKCAALDEVGRKFGDDVRDKDKAIAIATTLSVAALDEDPKVATAAAYVIYKLSTGSIFFTLSKEPGLLTKDTAQRFIKILTLPTTTGSLAGSVAAAVTKFATIAGETEALLQTVDGLANDVISTNVLSSIMVFGRMTAFERVKAGVAGTDLKYRYSGIQAPGNMPKWTPEEETVLCPWAEGYLADADLEIAAAAADMMIRCRLLEDGKYIDSLLAEGKKRVEAGEWKRPFVWAFRNVCFGGVMGEQEKMKPEVCQKTYDFLEWIVNQESVDAPTRGLALGFIYYQARNAETHALMKKYENHPVEEVKKAALDAIKSLEENYLKKQ